MGAVHAQYIDRLRQAFAEVASLLCRAKAMAGTCWSRGSKRHGLPLIVRWQSLADHTPGFGASDGHRLFTEGLQADFSGSSITSWERDSPTVLPSSKA